MSAEPARHSSRVVCRRQCNLARSPGESNRRTSEKSCSKSNASSLRQANGSGGGERTALEQRQHTRYGVRARVNFNWQDEGILYVGSGFTRDISSNGMFIYSDCLPPAKADINLEISFPPVAEAKSHLLMMARALVIRADGGTSPGEREGFAVLNRSYTIHDWPETRRSTRGIAREPGSSSTSRRH
jgi:PilZ domain